MGDTLTVEILYAAEERIYVREFEWLDREYGNHGNPQFLVAHTNAILPRALILWCRSRKCKVCRSKHIEEGTLYTYTYTPKVSLENLCTNS